MVRKAREIQAQINASAKATAEKPIGMTAPVNPPKLGFIGRAFHSFGISRQGKGLVAFGMLIGFFFLSQF
jgi:hypothetical protein